MERGRKRAAFTITRCAVLSALAMALYAVEIPVVAFYRLDLSTLPAILAGFAMGPVQGLFVVIVKNLLHMPATDSAFVGEIADMLMSGAFVAAAGLLYVRDRTRRGATLALAAGTAAMTVTGILTNYFVLIPAYQALIGMPAEAILAMGAAVHPWIDSMEKIAVCVAGPFNLLKGGVLSAVTAGVYKRVSPLLRAARTTERKPM